MGSLYLCSMPSFYAGVGRLLDFGNTFDIYNQTQNGNQADGIGYLLDWEMIREDFLDSMSQYDVEAKKILENPCREKELAAR